jgi:hypothetical protein
VQGRSGEEPLRHELAFGDAVHGLIAVGGGQDHGGIVPGGQPKHLWHRRHKGRATFEHGGEREGLRLLGGSQQREEQERWDGAT